MSVNELEARNRATFAMWWHYLQLGREMTDAEAIQMARELHLTDARGRSQEWWLTRVGEAQQWLYAHREGMVGPQLP